jgi:exopolysaccharide production protein ExoY
MQDEILHQRITTNGPANSLAHLRAESRPYAKRILDFCAAVVLIIIVLPCALLIIPAIVLGGQMPFYSHVRVGKGGREFGCLKFRSMCRNADTKLAQLLERDPAAKLEWETRRKLRNDPRITRLGRFLRATSLDELPQLINVLAGQMSLVGPRPVTRTELAEFYGSLEAAAYCSVRPGVTGLWQVSGRSELGYKNRVALDAFYAQHLCLRTDLVILAQTIDIVVRQRGAW